MAPELGLGNSVSAEPVSTLILGNTYSVDFDGVDDYVDTQLTPNASNGVSVAANATLSYWCNIDAFSGYQACGCHDQKRFYLGFNNQKALFGVANTYSDNGDLGTLTTGTWMHLALVAEGGTATYYFNGVNKDTLSYTQNAAMYDPTDDIFIGAVSNSASAVNFMDGKVDEVAVFNSALSAAQVASIYNGGKPQSLASYNPVGWWRMGDNDGGTGSTITDQGSGENNGTLTNMATDPFSTSIP